MENCYGQLGWREFHENREDILHELDRVFRKTEGRPVRVAHGNAVEAFIRKWLAEFLPKKYGVTSGYIIPDLYDSSGKLYHHDVIIYNQLDAPVLWTEGNEDQSEQGKYRAIPAKHVIAVYEVKSRLTKSNVIDALDKLNQTKDFSEQLNSLYSCGVIFIDLKKGDNNNKTILKELLRGENIFGFTGGMVLRYEGDNSCTGIINIFDIEEKKEDENKLCTPLAKPIDDLNIFLTEDGNLQLADQGVGAKFLATSGNWSVSKIYNAMYNEAGKSINLSWSRGNFADFSIQLLSTLEGLPYNDKNRPIFGQIFDNIERKKALLQNEIQEEGKPFLDLKLYEGGEYGEKVTYNTSEATISFIVAVENKGVGNLIISDDSFKISRELKAGEKAIKPVTLKINSKKSLKEFLKEEPSEIQYRIVYYTVNAESNKEFYAIERNLRITADDVEFT